MKKMLFMAMGAAMDNARPGEAIIDGSAVIGVEVADKDVEEMVKTGNDNTYIIITEERILIRQIFAINSQFIRCRALNANKLRYPDLLVRAADCNQFFKVTHFSKTPLPILQNMTIPLLY